MELLKLLPHTLLQGDTTLLTDVSAQNVFLCFVVAFFFLFYNGNRAPAPPSFIMQNATAIMNVFFCAKKMLLRCDVFHKRP